MSPGGGVREQGAADSGRRCDASTPLRRYLVCAVLKCSLEAHSGLACRLLRQRSGFADLTGRASCAVPRDQVVHAGLPWPTTRTHQLHGSRNHRACHRRISMRVKGGVSLANVRSLRTMPRAREACANTSGSRCPRCASPGDQRLTCATERPSVASRIQGYQPVLQCRIAARCSAETHSIVA